MNTKALEVAIEDEERQARAALDRLRDLAPAASENEVYDITLLLRRTTTLLGCLRRLCAVSTREEIHVAFGAPGDFGYGTPLGDALYKLYRGEP